MKVALNVSIFNQKISKKIASKILQKNIENFSIPLIKSNPILLYSLKSIRDVNNTENCRKAIEKQFKRFQNGEISKQEYMKNVKKIEEYYNDADNLPKNISSNKIKQNEPTFRANEDVENFDSEPFVSAAEEPVQVVSIHDTDFDISKVGDIDNIDVSMNSELQSYLITPEESFGEGLLDNIMDFTGGVADFGNDVFGSMKDFIGEIAGGL